MNIAKNKLTKFVIFLIISLGGQFLTFFISVLLGNKLSVYEFGIFNICMSVVNLGATLCYTWNSSISYYCGTKEISSRGNMSQTNLIRVVLMSFSYIIMGVIFIIFKERLNEYLGGKFIVIIYFVIVAKGIGDFVSAYLIARGKRQISAISLIIVESISIFIIFFNNIDIYGALYIQMMSSIFIIILIITYNKNDFKFEYIDKDFVKYTVSFALWQLIGSLSVFIISYGDNFIIKRYLTIDAVASYNVAYKLFTIVFMAANIISSYNVASVTKAYVSKDKNKLREFFYKERIVIFVLISIVHILLIFAAKPIIEILYQGKYNDSTVIFRILLFSSLLRYWLVYEMMYLNISGKFKIQQTLNIISAILKIIFGIIFIRYFGLLGMALSMILSTIIVAIISILICEPKIKNICKN